MNAIVIIEAITCIALVVLVVKLDRLCRAVERLW